MYARTWVRIYDTIDAASTPAQRATLAQCLHQIVHAPDPLRLVVGRLELELHFPDCIGCSPGPVTIRPGRGRVRFARETAVLRS